MPAPSSSTVTMERGNLYLAGEEIDSVAKLSTEAALTQGYCSQTYVANRATRDGVDHHMTLLSVKELRDIVNQIVSRSDNAAAIRNILEPLNTDTDEPDSQPSSKRVLRSNWRERLLRFCSSFLNDHTTRSQDWFVLGIGRQQDEARNSCVFLVCLYPRAAALRKKLGLSPKDFHITLGFCQQDIHDCSKGIQSIIRPQPYSLEIAPTRIISTPIELVEMARGAILREAGSRFFYGAALLNAAESILSLQHFQQAMNISQCALRTLFIAFENKPRQRRTVLDILEMRWRILGNKSDFDGVIEHANLWIGVLEETNGHSKSIALGYKGVALYMQHKLSKAYPCLRQSYEYFQRFQDGGKWGEKRLERSIETVLAKCCKALGYEAPLPPVRPFPRTAHLFDTGGSAVSSDDWVLSAGSPFFCKFVEGARVIVEEKIDGANIGISLSMTSEILAQNRSHYVTQADHSQFGQLPSWIGNHRQSLIKILSSPNDFDERTASQGLILYGEWCVAKHSIKYNKLPGYFIAFDLYDRREQKFFSRNRFHEILQGSGIPCAPTIASRSFGPYPNAVLQNMQTNAFTSDVRKMLDTKSRFTTNDVLVEGIVLRIEDEDSKWLEHRVKIVRPDFVQNIQEHWTHCKVEKQIVDLEFALNYCSITSDHSFESSMESKHKIPRDATNPREQQIVVSKIADNNESVILPRNFSFLWNGEVALSSTPTSRKQIEAWKEHFRTSLVITLMEEQPLPESWFPEKETCANLFVPVPNYQHPSIDQMNQMVEAIEDTIQGGGSVVVHCGGGKGRAGTVGACLLLKYGSLGIRASVCGGAMKAPQSFEDISTHLKLAKSCKTKRVILDRCNLQVSEREYWLEQLNSPTRGEVALVYFAANPKTCSARAEAREHHESIPKGRGRNVVAAMNAKHEPPTRAEAKRYSSIHTVHTYRDAEAVLRSLGARSCSDTLETRKSKHPQ